MRLRGHRLRPRSHRRRDRRVHRHGRERRRGHRRRPTTSRRWDGSAWSAVGAGSGGGNGWFSTTTSINALAGVGSNLFVTGTFQDANGDARADHVAFFDGTDWHPLGSDGAGNGPWTGSGLALALVDRQLYAAGNFTSAGGDPQAQSVASFALSQVIAYPTPTVTAGPSAVPTPTVTQGPSAVPTPTVTPSPPRPTSSRPRRRSAARRSTRRSARRRSGSPPASRAPRSPASSTARATSPAPRRRPTRSSRPASTCSASGRATAPATSIARRRSSASGSRSASCSSQRQRRWVGR